MQPIAARIPFMTCPGNHERFPDPGGTRGVNEPCHDEHGSIEFLMLMPMRFESLTDQCWIVCARQIPTMVNIKWTELNELEMPRMTLGACTDACSIVRVIAYGMDGFCNLLVIFQVNSTSICGDSECRAVGQMRQKETSLIPSMWEKVGRYDWWKSRE